MVERELTLRSLTPLVLHADRSRPQFTASLDYIPGSTLRGAMAACYLQAQGPDANFQTLFVGERIHFPDLLPSTKNAPGLLLPATARVCKRYGLKHERSLTDALLRLALAEVTGDLRPLKDAIWQYCPYDECQSRNKRDRFSGYVTPDYSRVQVKKRLLTGTSINRATQTAEAGMLFSQEAVEEGQYFRGVVRIAGEGAADLATQLEQVFSINTSLRVGSARSRGPGLVEVVRWGDLPVGPSLESRWMLFNRAVEALWRQYDVEPDSDYFSLTLSSHLILRDSSGRPVTCLEGRSDLDKLLGLEGVELRRHVMIPVVVRGWNAQQGLPKEDEPAIGRGSVLLFRVGPGHKTAVQHRLTAIGAEGLGRRRSEGFGRVRVCDPFHYHLVLRELGQEEVQ